VRGLAQRPCRLAGSADRTCAFWHFSDVLDLEALEQHLQAEPEAAAVLIDCTASDAVATLVPRWLHAGIHVVTPNKRAFSGPLALFEQVQPRTIPVNPAMAQRPMLSKTP